jgi:hypothetical protein
MPVPSLSPRPIFDPFAATPAVNVIGTGWRAIPQALRAFYRDRLSWLALMITSIVLCYGGGLAMFWFHAIELGEGGPAISWYTHWLLDSTVGFVALTPVLFVVIPLAVYWSGIVSELKRPAAALATYVILAGGLFALATVPGPVVHNAFVGRGTWLADRVTEMIGDPSAPLTPAQEYSVSALLSQQLGAAVAIYLVLTLLSVLMIRWLMTAAARRAPAGGRPATVAG